MLEDLKKQNADLDHIQKKLQQFLELKRNDFPRFYFLSDDELLEILANSQDKNVVQGFLKALFDGIYRLNHDDIPNILEMQSKEGEVIALNRPVKATG